MGVESLAAAAATAESVELAAEPNNVVYPWDQNELGTKFDTLKKKAAALQADNDQLTQEINNEEQKRQELTTNLKKKEAEVADLDAQATTLQQEINKFKHKLNSLTFAYMRTFEDTVELKNQVTGIQNQE